MKVFHFPAEGVIGSLVISDVGSDFCLSRTHLLEFSWGREEFKDDKTLGKFRRQIIRF